MSIKLIAPCRVVLGLLTTMAVVGCMTGSSKFATHQSPDGRYKYESYDLDDSAETGGFNKTNYSYHWSLLTEDGTRYERIEYYMAPARSEKQSYYQWPPSGSPRQEAKNGYVEEYRYDVCTTHPHGGSENGVILRTTHPHGKEVERSK